MPGWSAVISVIRSDNKPIAPAAFTLCVWLASRSITNERAVYGKLLIAELAGKLTVESGKGCTQANLRNMRQFYLTFPIRNALRSELNWTVGNVDEGPTAQRR